MATYAETESRPSPWKVETEAVGFQMQLSTSQDRVFEEASPIRYSRSAVETETIKARQFSYKLFNMTPVNNQQLG